MADLTLHSFKYCSSVENFVYNVPNKDYIVSFGSFNPGECVYNWSCTCKGFRYRKTCSHIEQAKPLLCNWDEFMDGPCESNTCPKCDKKLYSRMVGV